MNSQFGYIGSTPPAVPTYVGYVASSSDLTTYNFGSFTIPADGLVVILVSALGQSAAARTLVSATIGGSTADLVETTNSYPCLGIACLPALAGSRAVTATFSAGCEDAAVYVWVITSYVSATAADNSSNASSGSTSRTLSSVTVPQDGCGIFAAMHMNASEATAWTGATEAADNQPTGYFSTAANTADATVTATWVSSNACAIVGAAWR